MVKKTVSGIGTRTNICVSLHTSMITFITICQYNSEANDAYLERFKSKFETLKLAGGEVYVLKFEDYGEGYRFCI